MVYPPDSAAPSLEVAAVVVVLSDDLWPPPMVYPPSYDGRSGAVTFVVGSPHPAATRINVAAMTAVARRAVRLDMGVALLSGWRRVNTTDSE
jgi:hypothetical protein